MHTNRILLSGRWQARLRVGKKYSRISAHLHFFFLPLKNAYPRVYIQDEIKIKCLTDIIMLTAGLFYTIKLFLL